MVLGVVGEYVGKVFDETRARPTFIVAEQIGERRKDQYSIDDNEGESGEFSSTPKSS